jgi:hypothetical protein
MVSRTMVRRPCDRPIDRLMAVGSDDNRTAVSLTVSWTASWTALNLTLGRRPSGRPIDQMAVGSDDKPDSYKSNNKSDSYKSDVKQPDGFKSDDVSKTLW